MVGGRDAERILSAMLRNGYGQKQAAWRLLVCREGKTKTKKDRKRWDQRYSKRTSYNFSSQGALNVDSEIQHSPIFSGLFLPKSYRSLQTSRHHTACFCPRPFRSMAGRILSAGYLKLRGKLNGLAEKWLEILTVNYCLVNLQGIGRRRRRGGRFWGW